MQVVDAQIHTWGSGLPSNMSHWQVTHFTPEEAIALMDEAGVDATIIHPPGWDPGAIDMPFRAVRDHPGRFAIMGRWRSTIRNPAPGLQRGGSRRECSVCATRSCTTR